MDNTEDFFKNYRVKYRQYWAERCGLIPELPTSFDNANSMYEFMAWLQGDIVKSVTIAGATGLADVESTQQGDLTLILKRDTTKVDKTVFDATISELLARVEALELKTQG